MATTAVAGMAAALALSSCGPAGLPERLRAEPGASSEQTASRESRHVAPKVTQPLSNTDRWQRSPCDLLTGKQLSRQGFDQYRATPTGHDGGPGCIYSELSFIEVRTTIFTDIPGGFARLYAERGGFSLFQPIDPLLSHPAVIADVEDQRKQGRCVVFVGLTDDLAYRTIVEADSKSRAGSNPCAFATDLTVIALQNMKGGR